MVAITCLIKNVLLLILIKQRPFLCAYLYFSEKIDTIIVISTIKGLPLIAEKTNKNWKNNQ